jgi:hypothetical protein
MMRTIGIAVLACLSIGCATVTRGDKQSVKFESKPTSATVMIDGKGYTTPFSATLKRRDTVHVVASSPGYQSLKFDLSAERDLAAVPNLIVPGGSALMATDVATGADKKFPSPVMIKFTEKGPSLPPVEMKQFGGRVMTPAEYDKALVDYKKALYENRPVNQKHPNQPRQ